jgi:putative peptidoglycan binding protein/D-alanyl-D-alanine carboxypeptidase-like protein
MPTTSAITKLVPLPTSINVGVSNAKQATMLGTLGNPRSDYDDTCREVTNPTLKARIELASVGPFRVQGLRPAVAALKQILSEVAVKVPDVHGGLGSAGMLCARLVRNTTTHAISNHSWGTAIDLTLDGILDTRGDNLVQEGLTRIAPIFNQHGWFWGAGFATEDAMHFEAGDALIRQWQADGEFGPVVATVPESLLMVGDRGPEVVALQRKLNTFGAAVKEDGIFGTGTRAAVMAFQGSHGLRPDGVAGEKTRAALGL